MVGDNTDHGIKYSVVFYVRLYHPLRETADEVSQMWSVATPYGRYTATTAAINDGLIYFSFFILGFPIPPPPMQILKYKPDVYGEGPMP